VISLILVLALVACNSTTKSEQRPANNTTPSTSIPTDATTEGGEVLLVITAHDFSFTLNRTTVPAGRIHVKFINQSKDYKHEVWIYPQQQPRLQQMLELKRAGRDVEEADYLQGLAGHVEDVPPGQTAAFDVTLTPGTYELGCFITSDIAGKKMLHYDMGMHTLITAQ